MPSMDNSVISEPPGALHRSSRFIWPAILALIAVIAAAAGTYTGYFWHNSCKVNAVREASAFLVTQRNTYDNAYQFATTVSRTSLEHPVSTLKQILIATQAVDVPACMQSAKDELLHYMETVIRAFLAYGAQETDTTVNELIHESEIHYDNFAAELDAVNQCAPFCIPGVHQLTRQK